MKVMRTLGLIVGLLFVIRLSGAQALNTDVGIPISSAGNPGGETDVLVYIPTEAQAAPIQINLWPPGTTTFAGDLILYNQAGGDAPSNWYADVRFFNPLDPTGSLDLPATELEAFFPNDLGAGGFSSFQLFPDYNLVPANPIGGSVFGSEALFGPVGGILPGQLAIIEFTALVSPSAAGTPEPGSVLLLTSGGISLLIAYRRSRSRTKRE